MPPSREAALCLNSLFRYVFLLPFVFPALCPSPSAPSLQWDLGLPAQGECLPLQAEETAAPTVDLILSTSHEESVLAIAAALVGKLRDLRGPTPLLLQLSPPVSPERMERVSQSLLEMGLGNAVVLGPSEPREMLSSLNQPGRCELEFLDIDRDPLEGGVRIARRFWHTSDRIVVADLEAPKQVIIAATLAAHFSVPFIPISRRSDARVLRDLLWDLDVRSVVHVEDPAAESPSLDEQTLGVSLERMSTTQAEERIIQKLGASNIRNVILCRVPKEDRRLGLSSWLAPYQSSVRNAPIVFSDSGDGAAAEKEVHALVQRYGLTPQTVTILADYDSIGLVSGPAGGIEDETVPIEPCSGFPPGGAVCYGVGRIPNRTLERASLLLARGLVRERNVTKQREEVLMVANPVTGYGALPLCETIARSTAAELKNCGIRVREFYQRRPDNARMLEAATTATMILYQGHITELAMFGHSEDCPEPDDGLGEPGTWWSANEQVRNVILERLSGEAGAGWDLANAFAPLRPGPSPHDDDCYRGEQDQWDCWDGCSDTANDVRERGSGDNVEVLNGEDVKRWNGEWVGRAEAANVSDERFPERVVEALNGFPIVFLQSCQSLDASAGDRLFDLGAAGLIGSVTNIHSASGSAFVKAFCDGLVRRQESVGEALRDAKNYFLCLVDLKKRRGHREQHKSLRVALSFRFWGDPEFRLPGVEPRLLRKQPLTARMEDSQKIILTTPEKRLRSVATTQYFTRLFAGNQLAGIVKRSDKRSSRRIAPLYFARIDIPETVRYLTPTIGEGLHRNRCALVSDFLGRYVYVLFYPERLEPNSSIEIPVVWSPVPAPLKLRQKQHPPAMRI